MSEGKEWFATWFDSPYYHQLYANRDVKEAKDFLHRLVERLSLTKGARVVDLACGKGRHAITLNELGMEVLGLDLSPQSIAAAHKFSNETLRFEVHDMRDPFPATGLDAVFNLFTSFGYFNSQQDNLNVLRNMYRATHSGGVVVIDFMNTSRVLQRLVPHQVVERGDLSFDIRKKVEDGIIIKEISFIDQGHSYEFAERVQALELPFFLEMFEKVQFKVENLFGDYGLGEYDAAHSERMIFVLKKADS